MLLNFVGAGWIPPRLCRGAGGRKRAPDISGPGPVNKSKSEFDSPKYYVFRRGDSFDGAREKILFLRTVGTFDHFRFNATCTRAREARARGFKAQTCQATQVHPNSEVANLGVLARQKPAALQ